MSRDRHLGYYCDEPEPTPVSDAAAGEVQITAPSGYQIRVKVVGLEIARKLERERDEARRLAEHYRMVIYRDMGLRPRKDLPWEKDLEKLYDQISKEFYD